jgi:hypothetical protein
MFESITQLVGLLLLLSFPAWGIAGLVASLWNKRSTLRTWWFGSRSGLGARHDAGRRSTSLNDGIATLRLASAITPSDWLQLAGTEARRMRT